MGDETFEQGLIGEADAYRLEQAVVSAQRLEEALEAARRHGLARAQSEVERDTARAALRAAEGDRDRSRGHAAQLQVLVEKAQGELETERAIAAQLLHERTLLAQAIGDAARKTKIAREDAELTGPHLMMLCEDMANLIVAQQGELARHHADFAEWERMAANGSGKSARVAELTREVQVLSLAVEIASGGMLAPAAIKQAREMVG